jgi:predicted secreted protein
MRLLASVAALTLSLALATSAPAQTAAPVKVCTSAADRKVQNKAAQRAQESMQAPTSIVPN